MNKTKIEWTDYRIGYIAGMTEGDGAFKMPVHRKTYRESQWYWRVALKDMTTLKRIRQYLRRLEIRLSIKSFYMDMYKIETRNKEILNRIYMFLHPVVISKEYKRGYLAGIFDAEGNWYKSNLRIYNSNQGIRNKTINFASCFGFKFTEENYPSKKANGTRLSGDRFDQASFLCLIKSEKSRWYLRYIFWRD